MLQQLGNCHENELISSKREYAEIECMQLKYACSAMPSSLDFIYKQTSGLSVLLVNVVLVVLKLTVLITIRGWLG